jgi:hypothetical protein
MPAILPLLPLIQAIPSHTDAAKCTILSGVKESTSAVLDGVKGVSDAVGGVLDGVREEGTSMREATTAVQVSLKESRERANEVCSSSYRRSLLIVLHPVV